MTDPEKHKKDEQQPQRPEGGPTEGKSKGPWTFLMPLMLLGLFALLFFVAQKTLVGSTDKLSLNEFYELLAEGKIEKLSIAREETTVTLREAIKGSKKRILKILEMHFIENNKADLLRMTPEEAEKAGFSQKLINPHPPEVKFDPGESVFLSMLSMLLVTLVVLGLLWFLFFRQVRGSMGASLLSFGKSKAKLSDKNSRKVTFGDVAGINEAKDEVKEIIEFLKHPGKFRTIGARIPKGVLLVGPPGTGKTLLAKAIAGEADVPFFSISGSDFVEMFVGVGASRVRDLFKQAKSNAPCIIFLDEIDAVGRRRGSGLGGGHDEREQTLNAILVEMDGFETDAGIIMVAATNRPDILDPALLRPGRFDREVMLDLPDLKGREAILKVHARNVKIEKGLDFSVVARMTPMFSGAELEALINEAALLAVMRGKQKVDMECIEESRDKVRWGREKKSRIMSEEDRKITAYHESGHAMLGQLLPDVDPLHKVTIIPRGIALGATMQLPEKDRYIMRRNHLLSTLKVLLGGYISESLFCGDISSGSQNDLKNATELVRMMVCEWGMSASVGPVNYSVGRDTLFLGKDWAGPKNFSEATAQKIDEEIKRIITEAYEQAKSLMLKKKNSVHQIAEALLKYESLSGEEVRLIVEGKKWKKNVDQLRADKNSPAAAGEPQRTPRTRRKNNGKKDNSRQ